jgi:ankyrin repeat protein
VNQTDSYGNTPLHRACSVSSANESASKSAEKIVDLLLATKSIRNIDTRNKNGETPLIVACLENHHR